MKDALSVSYIQRFSSDDGPGIRTTVFLKGCSLRCAWCHNPECIDPLPKSAEGAAARVASASAGPFKEAGRYDIDRILGEVAKDEKFYRTSGGGVTVSGGEPLLQAEELLPFLRQCKGRGYTVCLDTAGDVDFAAFDKVLPLADVFLYDIKAYHEDVHRHCTGVGNARILANLQRLVTKARRIWVRIPVVPGWNAPAPPKTREESPDHAGPEGEMEGIAAFLAALPRREVLERVELLPYHAYGVGKYETLGKVCRTAAVAPPDQAYMRGLAERYRAVGLPAVTG